MGPEAPELRHTEAMTESQTANTPAPIAASPVGGDGQVKISHTFLDFITSKTQSWHSLHREHIDTEKKRDASVAQLAKSKEEFEAELQLIRQDFEWSPPSGQEYEEAEMSAVMERMNDARRKRRAEKQNPTEIETKMMKLDDDIRKEMAAHSGHAMRVSIPPDIACRSPPAEEASVAYAQGRR